jgi:hypothetical protein
MRLHVRRPVLAALFLVASLYCYAGYALVASLAIAQPERDYSGQARLYAAGMFAALAAAAGLALSAWLRSRAGRRNLRSSPRPRHDG